MEEVKINNVSNDKKIDLKKIMISIDPSSADEFNNDDVDCCLSMQELEFYTQRFVESFESEEERKSMDDKMKSMVNKLSYYYNQF